jgi:hypothetical protein
LKHVSKFPTKSATCAEIWVRGKITKKDSH